MPCSCHFIAWHENIYKEFQSKGPFNRAEYAHFRIFHFRILRRPSYTKTSECRTIYNTDLRKMNWLLFCRIKYLLTFPLKSQILSQVSRSQVYVGVTLPYYATFTLNFCTKSIYIHEIKSLNNLRKWFVALYKTICRKSP